MSALALALGGRRLGLYQQAGNGVEARGIKLLERTSPSLTKRRGNKSKTSINKYPFWSSLPKGSSLGRIPYGALPPQREFLRDSPVYKQFPKNTKTAEFRRHEELQRRKKEQIAGNGETHRLSLVPGP